MVVLSSPTPANENIDCTMSYYIHCNACYFRPGMGVQRRLFITNCSHIYCEACVDSATKDKCKVCKSQCSTLCLSSKLPKEVEGMFMDPGEPILKFLKETYQRLEFQKSHQKRLIRHLTEQIKQMNMVIKQAQKLEKDYLHLKSQNDYLMRIMQKNNPNRGNSRAPGIFQASPSNASPSYGKNQGTSAAHFRPAVGANFLPQTGRLSMRTPPSGGRLGTTGGFSYPSSREKEPTQLGDSQPNTPLTIPRPIYLGKE